MPSRMLAAARRASAWSTWEPSEEAALRSLFPGPGAWCIPEDFHHLQEMGFPLSIPDATQLSLAIRFRVAHCEATAEGGLAVRARAQQLRQWTSGTEHVDRPARWHLWFQRAFIFQLDKSLAHYAGLGVRPEDLEDQLVQGAPRPLRRGLELAARRSFQRAAVAALPSGRRAWLEVRARHKLERWNVAEYPRIRAQRWLDGLRRLASAVPPRVLAAVWRTAWNGWMTHRRFPDGRGVFNRCIFCGPSAPDAIEHYAACPAVWRFAAASLGLRRPDTRAACLSCFLLLGTSSPAIDAAPDVFLRKALRPAAVYRVHYLVRHGAVGTGETAREALRQSVRELVRGHAAAQRALGHWC